MDASLVIAITITAAVFLLIIAYLAIKWRFERAFHHWQQDQFKDWQKEKELAQKQAISQSRAVLGGKFTEQMAPYLPEFKYDPTEARFIGSPIDMVVFPGLSIGDPREIVIMEIKSGSKCQLTSTEKKIQKLIEDGMVRWELITRQNEEESAD